MTEVLPLHISAVDPPAYAADPGGLPWKFSPDLLEADLDTPAFTLEEGMWRTVVTHQTPFEDVHFQDYAGNEGWSVRFGDGAFGRPPEVGTILEVVYFTAPGTAANLAHDSVTHLEPPPGAPVGLQFGYASAVTNPLPITTGTDEETPDRIRINTPEAFRALPLRAVRPEDFSAIIERLEWVQRANATSRWTGSWVTDFVAADPRDGFALTSSQRAELLRTVDCVRQVTRDVRIADPDYLDIDLFVKVCVRDNAYPGEVAPRVEKALAAPGFFDPDNFTFGQPLRRSALEAAVQGVPGVKGVDEIRLRVRRRRDWHTFTEAELAVAPSQIIRLQNDPRYPGRGSLRVQAHGGVT
jgi:predicted phage baseplate assembly protein